MNNIAQSLADKLSSLDLTDDEATMLTMLIGGTVETDDPEVVGFGRIEHEYSKIGVGELQECTISKSDPIREQIGLKIGPPTLNWSWGMSQSG